MYKEGLPQLLKKRMCLNLIKKLASLKTTRVCGEDTMIPSFGNEYNQFNRAEELNF